MADTRTLNLRLPVELVEDFRALAGAEDRSIAAELRHLMREAVAAREDRKDERPACSPASVTTPAGGVSGHVPVY